MVVKAWPHEGSGGRKPEVLIKVVIGEGNSGDRERKPRSLNERKRDRKLTGGILRERGDGDDGLLYSACEWQPVATSSDSLIRASTLGKW